MQRTLAITTIVLLILTFNITMYYANNMLTGLSVYQESPTWQNNLTNTSTNSIALADYDNDGYVDMAVIGFDGANRIAKIYHNNGTSLNENTNYSANLIGVKDGSLTWTDYNNDAKNDLIIAGESITGRTTRAYTNNGTTLNYDNTYSANLAGVDQASITAADYNNDGKTDLAITGYRDASTHKITKLYKNNGTTFIEDTAYETNLEGISKGAIAFADYNKDGKIDIVIIGENELLNPTAKLYKNNGTTFIEDTTYEENLTGTVEGSLMWQDYDNDGDLDLTITGSYTAKVYENTGTKLQENNAYTQNLTGIITGSITWGDYNNDGKTDLALSGYTTSFESITKLYQNTGTNLTEYDENLTGVQRGTIAFADLDNDGDLDLIAAGQHNGNLATKVYINNITTPNTLPTAPTTLTSNWVALQRKINLSWTGATDTKTPTNGLYYNLIIGTTSGGNEVLSGANSKGANPQTGYYGNMLETKNIMITSLTYDTYYWSVQTIDTSQGTSNWSTEQNFTVPMCSDGIENDEDGKIDYPDDPECYGLYDLDEFGPYLKENTTWQNNLIGVRSGAAAFGDYDNDGDMDLVITGTITGNYTTKVYNNNGTSFANSGMNFTGLQYSSTQWADINNDGKLDLIIIGESQSTFYGEVYTNVNNKLVLNSTINFTGELPGVHVGSIALADINYDGYLDIAVSGRTTNQNYYTKILLNNGTTFKTSTQWSANLKLLYRSSIALGDLNNDGKTDMVLAGVNGSDNKTITVYLNNGTTLNPSSAYSSSLDGVSYGSLNLGDYNNDGYLDLIIAGDNESYIAKAFRNTGTSFVFDNTYSQNLTGVRMGSAALGDYDNDGDLDLAISGESIIGNTTKIYQNNGTTFKEFWQTQQYLIGVKHSAIAWQDIDNDNDLDLIVTGQNSSGQLLTKIYTNDMSDSNPNNKPTPPTTYTNIYQNGLLNLTWGQGNDNETSQDGLYYNLIIGNSSGATNTVTGMFGGSGKPTNGYFGNMLKTGNILLNITPQKYWWKIQTIDTTFAKSNWSTEHWTAPLINATIPNQTWPEDTTNTNINLMQYFYHIENNDLNWTASYVPNITVQINNNTEQAMLIPDGNFTGIRYVTFTAWDSDNSYITNNNITLNITPVNDPPTAANLLTPTQQYNTSNTQPSFDWTDSNEVDEGDIITYYLEIDDNENFTTLNINQATAISQHTLTPAQNLTDGIWHWRIKSCDQTNATNNCSYSTQNWTFRTDTTAPQLTIQSPTQNDIVGWNVLIQTNITDLTVIDTARYEIANSSGIVATGTLTATNNWDTNWTTTQNNPPDNNYTLTIYANDTLGHLRTASVNFSLDNTAPGIQTVEPSKKYYNTDFNLNIYTNSLLLKKSNYTITNSTGNVVQSNANNSINTATFTWTDFVNATNYEDDNYTLTIYSEDNVGNNRTEQTWFEVDNTKPRFDSPTINPTTIYNNDTVQLNITWTDDNIDTVIMSHNASGSWTNYAPTINGNTYTITINSSMLENGERIGWTSNANDSAGNTNTTPIYEFNISNRAPYLNQTIQNKTWQEDTTYNFTITQFLDQDNDDLNYTYSYVNITHINVTINNNTAEINLTPAANWYGTEYMIITAHDQFGATADTNNITLTVNNVPDCGDGTCEIGENSDNCIADCPKPSGGGSGGGGIGNETEHKTTSYYNIIPNKEYLTEFDGEELLITRIFFMTNKELQDVSFNVELPNQISVPALQDVYKYANIIKTNIENQDLVYLRMEIAVKKDWAKQNGYDSLKFMRYSNGWQEVRIKNSTSNENYDHYIAYPEGFSTFAVVGQKQVKEEPKVPATPKEENITKEEQKQEEIPEIRQPKTQYTQYIAWTTALIIMVFVLLITTIAIERKRAKMTPEEIREIKRKEEHKKLLKEAKIHRENGIKEREKLITYKQKVDKHHKKMYEMLKKEEEKKARKHYDKALKYYNLAKQSKQKTAQHFNKTTEIMNKLQNYK